MSLTVKDNGSFIPAPEGLHIARCYGVVDLGKQLNKKYGTYSPKARLCWELSNAFMPNGKPFIQMQTYSSVISENSRLRPLLESWRGKPFTDQERKAFKLRSLLGMPCYLALKQVPMAGAESQQLWSNVVGIYRLPSTVICPPLITPTLFFDLDEYSEDAFFALPEPLQKQINLRGIQGVKQAATTLITGVVSEEAEQDVLF
jgi:hypothetical protein